MYSLWDSGVGYSLLDGLERWHNILTVGGDSGIMYSLEDGLGQWHNVLTGGWLGAVAQCTHWWMIWDSGIIYSLLAGQWHNVLTVGYLGTVA